VGDGFEHGRIYAVSDWSRMATCHSLRGDFAFAGDTFPSVNKGHFAVRRLHSAAWCKDLITGLGGILNLYLREAA